jgi:predicted ATPase
LQRYIFTGAPGAGKTTLVHGLAALGYMVVEEAATDVIAEQQGAGVSEPWTAAEFISDVLRLQVARQGVSPAHGVVLFDRSPVCTLALTRFLNRPIPQVLTDEVGRLVANGFYQREVFFVRPLGFVRPTAARRITYEDSLAFEAIHESTYRSLGFTLIDVPHGTPAGRIALVDHTLAAHGSRRAGG